ncbi:RING-H2 finger protein ATL48 [Glycine max]|nr:RING-H2 finger protein ATL48 [Glycine max]KHN48609.1 RING-H2 finger protein ATL48 [Glycine soja]
MKSFGYLGWLDLPFVPHVPFPTSALVTAGVLTAGLISFRQGNSQLGQKLMRARVVVQGATVALMVGTAFYYGENPWRSS